MLVHDQLLAKRGIALPDQNPMKQAILKHKTRLKAEYIRAQIKMKKEDNGAKKKVRWFRINPIQWKEDDKLLLNQLLNGWTESKDLNLNGNFFYKDTIVPHLYGIPLEHTSHLTSSIFYTRGEIILQDKASCFPILLLDPKPGEEFIDACSAPGNKTTHLASVLREGKVYAIERDQSRFKELNKMVAKAGASNSLVETVHGDFLSIDPQDDAFKRVRGIVLDPSCSGSGLDSHGGEAGDDTNSNVDPVRLEKLSNFQSHMLDHALKFTNVRRVVYSTCSVHAEENERVVEKALERNKGWRLLQRNEQGPLQSWPIRGIEGGNEIADSVIRANLGDNHSTIGFFVAAFVRN